MKKRDLQNAYGRAPRSFHNSIVRTLNTLDTGTSCVRESTQVQAFDDFDEERILTVQPRKHSVFKTVTACVLSAAIVSVGAVSAKAIFPMVAEREGNYGLNIEMEPGAGGTGGSLTAAEESRLSGSDSAASDETELMKLSTSKSAPEYVKMNIGYLPEGVIEDQGKYSLNGNHKDKCLTISGSRVVKKQTIKEENIVDYEEFDLNGNRAILATSAVGFSKRFFIFFEKEAVCVEAYVTDDISDDEIKKVMENITVEECTAEESNIPSLTQQKEYNREAKEEELAEKFYSMFEHEPVYNYCEVALGQKITYGKQHGSSGLELSVDKIDVLDNISELDYNSFNESIAENHLPYLVDENGNCILHNRDWYTDGDGVSAPIYQVTRSDEIASKLVYVTLTVNNPTNENKEFFFQGFGVNELANTLAVQNGTKTAEDFTSENEEYSEPIMWGEVHYIDNNNVARDGYKRGYNFLDVEANSTQTIHIGFFVDEDKLDETYLTLDECWSASSVFDPNKSEFVDNDKDYYYGIACIKVQ